MEKKVNKDTNGTENKENVKFRTKVKNAIVKAWNSKPAKVARDIGEGVIAALGVTCMIYAGTRAGFRDGMNDVFDVDDFKNPTLPELTPEVPFVESEPVEDTAE